MNKTVTITIAGPASAANRDWIKWEELVLAIAAEIGLQVTHGATTNRSGEHGKFTPYKPLLAQRRKQIAGMGLASVPPEFLTVIQDAKLYADRSKDGVYVIVAAEGLDVTSFVERNLPRLKEAVTRVEGQAVFVLPPSKLAANYVDGMNDVRKCEDAEVLLYEAGGFLHR